MTLQLQFTKQMPFHDLKVDYHFKENITAVMGASGSGKSTLFQCISGLKHIDSGTIQFGDTTFDDTSIALHLPTAERKIGYLFQNLALFPNMNVYDNISFGLKMNKAKRKDTSAISRQVRHMSDYLQISHLLYSSVQKLSGGEKQRVAMARAMIINPHLLLLDEPFNGLDEDTRYICMDLVQNMAKDFELPVIFVTHYRFEAQKLTNEIIYLKDGHLEKEA
ncbi:Maltose/maltodextrin import ATP-binding protein MalK [Listeria fleischmannii subsp. coloradonensis]|nr:Maltose/maltodextrin import ATP-binding protein MalK [Listeria fleischmannii subsp. coloradonensis]